MTPRAGIAAGAALALAGAVPWLVGPYGLTIALNAAMWVALTVSWSILGGTAAYISLGHVAFYGLGAYVVVTSWQVLPLVVAVPLGGLVAGAFALTIGWPVLRVRGPYFVILTLGIAELVKYAVLNVEAALGASSRLLFGVPDNRTLYLATLGLAVLAIIVAALVRRSRLGAGLVAVREDEVTAETIGVPIGRYKVFAFALSAVIPGMVGGLMALRSAYFEPLQVFNPVISFTIVTMAVVGGAADARGPILGALLLVVVSELLWANAPQGYMIALGVLLIGFVVFAPGGITGALARPRP
ncbi:MAG: branched-chain amino acid ABC transporter permease [Alphaproteobacteria bacterium]|nr:branched-chain amino acid ABC transporter permease [Alphaproteobacteria bacterium]